MDCKRKIIYKIAKGCPNLISSCCGVVEWILPKKFHKLCFVTIWVMSQLEFCQNLRFVTISVLSQLKFFTIRVFFLQFDFFPPIWVFLLFELSQFELSQFECCHNLSFVTIWFFSSQLKFVFFNFSLFTIQVLSHWVLSQFGFCHKLSFVTIGVMSTIEFFPGMSANLCSQLFPDTLKSIPVPNFFLINF